MSENFDANGNPISADPTGTPVAAEPGAVEQVAATVPQELTPAEIKAQNDLLMKQLHDKDEFIGRQANEIGQLRQQTATATPATDPNAYVEDDYERDIREHEELIGAPDEAFRRTVIRQKEQDAIIRNLSAGTTQNLAAELDSVFTEKIKQDARINAGGSLNAAFFTDFELSLGEPVQSFLNRVSAGKASKQEVERAKALMNRSFEYVRAKVGASAAPLASPSAPAAAAHAAMTPPGIGGTGTAGAFAPTNDFMSKPHATRAEVEAAADAQFASEFAVPK